MAEDAITLDMLKRSVEAVGGKVRERDPQSESDQAYVVVEDETGELVFNGTGATTDEAAQAVAEGIAGRRVMLDRHLAWIGTVEKANALLQADPSRKLSVVKPVREERP